MTQGRNEGWTSIYEALNKNGKNREAFLCLMSKFYGCKIQTRRARALEADIATRMSIKAGIITKKSTAAKFVWTRCTLKVVLIYE